MKIDLSIEVSNQDISDICVTAFEGGINYWCGRVKILLDTLPDLAEDEKIIASDVIAKGGSLKLFDAEDDEETWTLTPENFKTGLEKYFADCYANNTEISFDPANIDANDADSIIQFAIFGELTFG